MARFPVQRTVEVMKNDEILRCRWCSLEIDHETVRDLYLDLSGASFCSQSPAGRVEHHHLPEEADA